MTHLKFTGLSVHVQTHLAMNSISSQLVLEKSGLPTEELLEWTGNPLYSHSLHEKQAG